MKRIAKNQTQRSKTTLLSIWLLVILVIFFTLAAPLIAYFTFLNVRKLTASWEMTNLPGVKVEERQTPPLVQEGEILPTPTPVISSLPPVVWDGVSRVNVLVVGIDYRDWESGEGAPRTDTMILFSFDPLSSTGGMLSIPRDLWVSIPCIEQPNRINTAHRFGELYKFPGGGPGLAIKTVENLLGLKIDYYAQIDFYAFEKFIDEIGGIELEIPKKIKVAPIGGHITTLKKGKHTLDGAMALAYARARYTEGGDFDRSTRQQEVITAIRKRLLEPARLPILINRAPEIYQQLSAGVHTNMELGQAIKLGLLVLQIPEADIRKGIIGSKQVTFWTSPEVEEVLKPLPLQIRILRDEIFSTVGALSPATEGDSLQALMQTENARIAIFNGSNTPGLATRTMDYLKTQGANIISAGDATEAVGYTTVVDHTGNPKTVSYLVDLMHVSAHRILFRYDHANQTDIELILGYDWATSNTLP